MTALRFGQNDVYPVRTTALPLTATVGLDPPTVETGQGVVARPELHGLERGGDGGVHTRPTGYDGGLAAIGVDARLADVGACPTCGVTFMGRPEHVRIVREALRVHATICPGGRRAGERATPMAALESSMTTARTHSAMRRATNVRSARLAMSASAPLVVHAHLGKAAETSEDDPCG